LDTKRAVAKALLDANVLVRAVVAGYSMRDGVGVIVVNVIFSRFEVNNAVFVERVKAVVSGLGGGLEDGGVGLGRMVFLFPATQ
jgi:hypothetical protein